MNFSVGWDCARTRDGAASDKADTARNVLRCMSDPPLLPLCSYYVEIKTQAGQLSDPQQSVMAAVLASGGRVGVVRNADEMLGLLDAWGIPRAGRLVRALNSAAH